MTLEIGLTRHAETIIVHADDMESHTIDIHQIILTKADTESFFLDPSRLGRKLYHALFAEDTLARKEIDALQSPSRLILRMDDLDLAGFPWEYLYDGVHWLSTRFALIRACLKNITAISPQADLPTRLLYVPSDPPMQGAHPAPYYLGVDTEWDNLVNALADIDANCDAIRIAPPGVKPLHQKLADPGNVIIHFTGHGTVDTEGNAFLIFEQPSGAADLVSAKEYCLKVGTQAQLVVLSACVSAVPGKSAEANLAGLLAGQGVPFVLGMQLSVDDATARQFTETFYRFLFAGRDIPEAMRQARISLFDQPLAMGIPVLYAADANGGGPWKTAAQEFQSFEPPKPELTGIATAVSGFFGRQRELVETGDLLTRERLRQGNAYSPLTVTLQGPGGIGKTALLCRVAERYAWAFRNGVLGISLEPLPSPAAVFDRIEKYFGFQDGSLLEIEKRIAQACEQLKGKRALLALDNFETLWHGKDSNNPAEKKNAFDLYTFFENLPARGVTLLVSSREITRLPGEKTVYVEGLDDVAGAQLFKSGVKTRTADLDDAVIYKINHETGGHPLALRLLGPIFDKHEAPTLKDFLDQLSAILPKAQAEWNEGRRHDTLQACFDFSLNYLSEVEAQAIARLSLFRGQFLDITAAPVLYGFHDNGEEQEKAMNRTAQTLRALFERGLLIRDILPIDKEEVVIFYSLHPALAIFARERLGDDVVETVKENYWQTMINLARVAEDEITKNVLMAVLTLRSLPDMIVVSELKVTLTPRSCNSGSASFCSNLVCTMTH
jgi:hypothetical protein